MRSCHGSQFLQDVLHRLRTSDSLEKKVILGSFANLRLGSLQITLNARLGLLLARQGLGWSRCRRHGESLERVGRNVSLICENRLVVVKRNLESSMVTQKQILKFHKPTGTWNWGP